jgi:hypothetical protein
MVLAMLKPFRFYGVQILRFVRSRTLRPFRIGIAKGVPGMGCDAAKAFNMLNIKRLGKNPQINLGAK